MEIITTRYNRCDVIKIAGRVDSYTAPKLQEAMDGLVDEGRYNIIFDMSAVDFLSSKGLWVLTETHKSTEKHHGKLVLAHVNERIQNALELVGLKDYFDIYDDLTAAVGSF